MLYAGFREDRRRQLIFPTILDDHPSALIGSVAVDKSCQVLGWTGNWYVCQYVTALALQ